MDDVNIIRKKTCIGLAPNFQLYSPKIGLDSVSILKLQTITLKVVRVWQKTKKQLALLR
jgi:hypothetical protein